MKINTINFASNSKIIFGGINFEYWNNIEILRNIYNIIKNQNSTFKLLLYLNSNATVYEKETALFIINKQIQDLVNYKELDNHNKDC